MIFQSDDEEDSEYEESDSESDIIVEDQDEVCHFDSMQGLGHLTYQSDYRSRPKRPPKPTLTRKKRRLNSTSRLPPRRFVVLEFAGAPTWRTDHFLASPRNTCGGLLSFIVLKRFCCSRHVLLMLLRQIKEIVTESKVASAPLKSSRILRNNKEIQVDENVEDLSAKIQEMLSGGLDA